MRVQKQIRKNKNKSVPFLFRFEIGFKIVVVLFHSRWRSFFKRHEKSQSKSSFKSSDFCWFCLRQLHHALCISVQELQWIILKTKSAVLILNLNY